MLSSSTEPGQRSSTSSTDRGPVPPDGPQLRIYALGALEEAGPFNSVSEIGITIVQPRSGGVKTVNMSVSELTNWEAGVLIPSARRVAAGDTTETPETTAGGVSGPGSARPWLTRA